MDHAEQFMVTPSEPATGRSRWLLLALAVGVVLGIPSGILLAYLAVMPVFLGMYFFLLIGLIVGAVMYRVARPAAPVGRPTLWLLGIAVSLAIWIVGPIAEYHWLKADVTRAGMQNSFKDTASDQEIARYEEQVKAAAKERLKMVAPPGGFIGFVRWAATNRQLELPRMNHGTFTFRAPGLPFIWIVRVGLALALVTFATISQLVGLGPRRPGQEDEDSEQQQAAA